jgi:hypothetical protein
MMRLAPVHAAKALAFARSAPTYRYAAGQSCLRMMSTAMPTVKVRSL